MANLAKRHSTQKSLFEARTTRELVGEDGLLAKVSDGYREWYEPTGRALVRAGIFPASDGLDEDFLKFHERNPQVFCELADLTQQAYDAGRRRVGIKMMFEVLRWNRIIRGLPDEEEEYKLNNNYHSRYARLLMVTYPQFIGMFEVRKLRKSE
jgi:hypothetical protein